MKHLLALAISCASLAGCSMLGRDTEFSESITTSGVGPFRHLTSGETGLSGSLVLAPPGDVHRGSVAGDVLFVDLTTDGRRAVHRARRVGRCEGFDDLALALEATEPWEGESVREPFALVRDDGTVRVYYAADGGIGMAEAESLGSPLVKSAENPLLQGALSGPTVIDDPAFGILMYFAEEGRIFAARSDDGLRFERIDAEATTPAIDPVVPIHAPTPATGDGGADEGEVAHSLPGAVVGEMPGGRRTVRLYFAAERVDGGRFITMAASLDGVGFERAGTLVLADDDASAPVPRRSDDEGHTLLLFVRAGENSATLHGALSPIEARLPGHPDRGTSSCSEL